jgi:hypothetical protein
MDAVIGHSGGRATVFRQRRRLVSLRDDVSRCLWSGKIKKVLTDRDHTATDQPVGGDRKSTREQQSRTFAS